MFNMELFQFHTNKKVESFFAYKALDFSLFALSYICVKIQ